MERLIKAFKYSVAGLRSCYREEPSFRQETWIYLLSIPVAFWLGDNGIEIVILLMSGMLVLIVELLNSAIENAANRIGREYHDLIKNAKDQGSAAVLLTIVITLFTWVYIGIT